MQTENKIIYHYTNIEGFQGIIESHSIWASDIRYLNDISELNYAKKLLEQEVILFCKENPKITRDTKQMKSWGHYFFETLLENVGTLLPSKNFSFYVCSFSEKKDLLSQWRGYGKNNTGFSIGFNREKLTHLLEKSKFKISPCIYEKNKQIEKIRSLILDTSETFHRKINQSKNIGESWDNYGKILLSDFMLKFIALAPTIKHPKFYEEKEWRVVASLKTEEIKQLINIRIGKTMFIPYIEIFLPMEKNKLIIEKLVIGPTVDHLLALDSVKILLEKSQVICKDQNVICSTIPYRAV